MTDELRETVVDPAAANARNPRARRWLALLAVVAAASALAFAGIAAEVFLREADLQAQVTTLAANAQQNNAAAQTLADQVRKLGGTPVVSPPEGPAGAAGPAGPAGRGITGTALSAGHLYVTYSDGATEDKGQVVGAAGAKGADGRGITGANATSGHLVLSYSDGSTSDAGTVVGPQGATGAAGAAGRSIKSVSTTGGELVVTYDDNSTADAGPLPTGPPGPPGPAGPSGAQGPPGADGKPPAGWTWTDILGRTYECQRDPGSPDNAPTYTCAAQSPTTTSTPSTLVRVPGH